MGKTGHRDQQILPFGYAQGRRVAQDDRIPLFPLRPSVSSVAIALQ